MDYQTGAQDSMARLPASLMGEIRRPSILERLHQERTVLDARLRAINDAIVAIESNPAVMDVFERVSRVTSL